MLHLDALSPRDSAVGEFWSGRWHVLTLRSQVHRLDFRAWTDHYASTTDYLVQPVRLVHLFWYGTYA